MRSQQLEDRRTERYDKLLAAGIELLGSPDGPSVNVRAVCRQAGLTERYFYESFTDRDQFVRAVYANVGERARVVLFDAVSATPPADRVDASVRAFVELMVDDPRMGRVLLIAPLSEPALSRRGLALLPGFVELVESQLSAARDRHIVAVGVVGALTALFIGYLDGTLDVGRDTLVEHCVRVLTRVQG